MKLSTKDESEWKPVFRIFVCSFLLIAGMSSDRKVDHTNQVLLAMGTSLQTTQVYIGHTGALQQSELLHTRDSVG